MLPGRARGAFPGKGCTSQTQNLLFSALLSFESWGLHLLLDSEYLAHVQVLMAALALLFWD